MYVEYLNDLRREYRRESLVIPCLTARAYTIWNTLSLEYDKKHYINCEEDSVFCDRKRIDVMRNQAISGLARGDEPIQDAILSIEQGQPNYYHFLGSVLPDILAMRKISSRQGLEAPLILISDFSEFASEYFEIFGLSESVRVVRGCVFSVKNCLMPNIHWRQDDEFRTTSGILSVRQQIDDSLLKRDTSFPERVFIDRKTSNSGSFCRRIFPVEEFHDDLRKNGYTVVYLEDIHVREKIRLFASAKVVAGVYGAGLTNLVFMRSDSKLIEITHEKVPAPRDYKELTEALGLTDHYQIPVGGVLGDEGEKVFQAMTMNPSVWTVPLKYEEHLKDALFQY